MDKLSLRFSKMAAKPKDAGISAKLRNLAAMASKHESDESPSPDNIEPGWCLVLCLHTNSRFVAENNSSKQIVVDTVPSVKGDARKTLAIIRRAAGYTTTMLKLMKVVSDKDAIDEDNWDIMYMSPYDI